MQIAPTAYNAESKRPFLFSLSLIKGTVSADKQPSKLTSERVQAISVKFERSTMRMPTAEEKAALVAELLNDPSPIAKPKNIAAYGNISVRTVTRMCENGTLKAAKCGNQWRINRKYAIGYFDAE